MAALDTDFRVLWKGNKVDIPGGWQEDTAFREVYAQCIAAGETVATTSGTDSGTLDVRTDDDTGTVGLAAGHGVSVGLGVDVSWVGGSRTDMLVIAVAGNDVTVDGGAGNVLPAAATAVTLDYHDRHYHPGVAHDHTGDAHSHTITTAGPWTTQSNEQVLKPFTVSSGTHTHSGTSEDATINYFDTTADSALCTSGATKPLSKTAYFIGLAAGNGDIPDQAITWTDEDAVPTDWLAEGDFNGKFIIGCAAADAAGNAAVGNATHAHVVANHLHDTVNHTHADTTVPASASATNKGTGTPPMTAAATNHTHGAINFQTVDVGDTSNTAITPNTHSNDPDHHILLAVRNNTGGVDTPEGVICAYMGAGAVPADWLECDGVDYALDLGGLQVECTSTPGGDGAGAGDIDNHSLTEAGHGHTHAAGHTHTFTLQTSSPPDGSSTGSATAATVSHVHSRAGAMTTGSTTPTLQNETATFSNADGRWKFRRVRFLKYSTTTVKPWWYYQRAAMRRAS
jgi:hypothetical protein